MEAGLKFDGSFVYELIRLYLMSIGIFAFVLLFSLRKNAMNAGGERSQQNVTRILPQSSHWARVFGFACTWVHAG